MALSLPVSSSPLIHFPRPLLLADIIRSRFRRPDIDSDTIQTVLAHYNLDLIGDPSNLPLSRRTKNVILNTSAGRMVLKRYRPLLQKSGIIYIHSILMRLADLKFPAPRLVMTPEGDNFVSLEGGNYALFHYIPGTNYSLEFLLPSDRFILMITAGQTLAHCHLSLREFNPEGQHHLGFVSHSGGWWRDMAWYEKKAKDLQGMSAGIRNAKDRSQATWLAENSGSILTEMKKLDDRLRTALPRCIAHGDFGLHNLIFQKSGTVVLTDFETARLEWRLGDLVTTLSRLRADNGSSLSTLSKGFLLGYKSVFPIPRDEWELLPEVWRFYKLRSVFIQWNSFFESGDASVKLAAARDALKQAAWALNHRDQLLRLGSG